MRVARFFRESATLQRLTGGNDFSGRTYDPPEEIKVRWYTENRLIRDDEGQELTTNARVSTVTEVRNGDLITPGAGGTARTVRQVRTNRDVRGRFSHYIAWLA